MKLFDLFYDKPSNIKAFLDAKGFHGTVYDGAVAYFQSKASAEGSIYDLVTKTLEGLGYSQTKTTDKITAFFTSKTGISGRKDSERAFWSNTALDFS